MSRLVKATWYFSIFLFLLVLLWVYAYLPKEVGVLADEQGELIHFIGRESFFYILLGLIIFTNVVFYAFRQLLLGHHERPFDTKKPLPARIARREDLASWALGFAAALNVFYMLGMIYLGVFNNQEGTNLANYGPVVYAGPFLIGVLLLILIYIFLKRRP